MTWQGHGDEKFGHITCAQHGEDVFFLSLFWALGIEKPSYLDIGAHHPIIISNTALLYRRGSTGINVEANPNLIEAFQLMRPNDINLNVGVGDKPGKMPFYMIDAVSGRNSFIKDEIDLYLKEDPNAKLQLIVDIDVVTINQIVEQHNDGQYPDLLSMDVEGLEYNILEVADFSKSYPKVICAEIRCGESQPLKNLLAEKDYFPLCRMVGNLIFVHDSYRQVVTS